MCVCVRARHSVCVYACQMWVCLRVCRVIKFVPSRSPQVKKGVRARRAVKLNLLFLSWRGGRKEDSESWSHPICCRERLNLKGPRVAP